MQMDSVENTGNCESTSQLTGLVWLIAAAGIIIRIAQYMANHSLWLDEAMLAMHVITRGWVALLTQPLTENQSAPLGFLLVQKMVVTLLGGSEPALRLWPLALGCATLILAPGPLHRLLPPPGRVAAMLILALNFPLVFYSVSAKQYSGDVFWMLLLLAAAAAGRPGWLVGWGFLAPWCSHPAALMLAGVAGYLWLTWPHLRAAKAIALLGMNALLAFAVHRWQINTSGIFAYWEAWFIRMPTSWSELQWLGQLLAEPLQHLGPAWLAWGLILLGAHALLRADRAMASMLVVPPLLVFAASAGRLYPLTARLSLFLLPALLVLLVTGAKTLTQRFHRRHTVLALLLAAITLPALLDGVKRSLQPIRVEELRPVLAWLQPRVRADDVVWVAGQTRYPFMYYQLQLDWQPASVVFGENHPPQPDLYPPALARLLAGPHRRVWMVFASEITALGEERFSREVVAPCDRLATRCDGYSRERAMVLGYVVPVDK